MIKIEELKNPKNIKILAIIIIGLIMGLMGLKSVFGLWSKNARLKKEITQKNQELTKISSSVLTEEAIQTQIKDIAEKISTFEKRFFFHLEDTFSDLNRFAENSQISFKAISPSEKMEVILPNTKEIAYLELPISLKLECGYYSLVSFLHKIENAENIMLINEIKIQGNPQNIWEHNIELSLKVPMFSPKKN